ncbi:MAG TPA: AI-2E family transporter [Phycisphaerae bacterium]|nr:AI-2E family transporter [Phycisphaerae bacterium]
MELDLQRFYNLNRRAVMWIIFFAGLYLLRDFFSLVFLTFIFGFLMRGAAKLLMRSTRAPYWAAVVGPYLLAIVLLILLAKTAIPRLWDEGAKFSRRVPDLFYSLAEEIEKAAPRYGLQPALNKYITANLRTELSDDTPHGDSEATASQPAPQPETTQILATKLQQFVLGFLPAAASSGHGSESLSEIFRRFINGVVGGTLTFLLAILLSFLIVLDYDKIQRDLAQWRTSPTGRFFHEAAASVVEFSEAVGQAFQCQMMIALLNAAITCAGLFILGIQPLVLLTTIVFLLGLIPVLGVFISSVPIILIAFNDFGLDRALLALGMIVVVHLLEAYVFNPRIYAARFHLNPVVVLIILLTAERLFGVWGMLLCIPVTHYVLNVAQMPSQPRKTRRADVAPNPSPPPE